MRSAGISRLNSRGAFVTLIAKSRSCCSKRSSVRKTRTISQPPLWGSVAPGGFVYLAVALDGSAAAYWRGGCRLRWRPRSASKRWRTPWRATASRRYSQFTGQTFTGALAGNGIAISMDGKAPGATTWFVERLWRSVKYEEVYLRAYDSVSEAVLLSAGILTSTMAAGPT